MDWNIVQPYNGLAVELAEYCYFQTVVDTSIVDVGEKSFSYKIKNKKENKS